LWLEKLVATAISDDDKKRLDLSNAILFDYDVSNSFPSIVKTIIEAAQKLRDEYYLASSS
jgi:hypothetical protein